jgi:hypothetical protein
MATEDTPIQGTSLALTRVTGAGTTITSLGTAAVALFTINAGDPDGVKIAKIAAAAMIIAVGLLATSWVTAADVRARGNAAAANPAPTSPTVPVPANGAAKQNGSVPVGGAVWVTVRDHGDQPFLLVEAQHLADDHTRYFVSRNNERPTWVLEDDIESWSVGAPST